MLRCFKPVEHMSQNHKSHTDPVSWKPEAPEQYLLTPRDLIRWGASCFREAGLFFGHGTDNALDEAAYLVLHALRLPLDLPDAYFDTRLLPSERQHAIELLDKRISSRLPAAYLTGEAWFAGLSFEVNEHVLIPRSPIAEMIEDNFEPWLGTMDPKRILDMGTGSGAIAIACAYAFPDAEVDAVDISPQALEVALRNISAHGLEGQVRALHSDLFSELTGQRYDLIVANPPYVDESELSGLSSEYHHEPSLALVAPDSGLALALDILRQAPQHLNQNGLLVLEVGVNAQPLAERTPGLDMTWVELEYGGEGVCVVTAEALIEYAAQMGA